MAAVVVLIAAAAVVVAVLAGRPAVLGGKALAPLEPAPPPAPRFLPQPRPRPSAPRPTVVDEEHEWLVSPRLAPGAAGRLDDPPLPEGDPQPVPTGANPANHAQDTQPR